ncbi:MAG: polyprenyl synthetase family protein [Planctomycetota bacterium]
MTTRSDFRAWLTAVGPTIEAQLQDSVTTTALADTPAHLREAMAYALLGGGKRVRPALCLLAVEACGGEAEHALPAAVAIEMIHAYSLVHDDLPCMDDDVLRRGRPTAHVRFGEATAVLAGDALQAQAFNTLAAQENQALALRQVQVLARAAGAAGMVGGQQLDMDSEGQDVDLEQVLAIHAGKTGALLMASLEMGVLAAGADPTPWREYAAAIGRLFQMSDDVLDATSSTEDLGKTAGKDEDAAKATVVGVLGLEGAQALMQGEQDAALKALEELQVVRHAEVLADLPRFLGTRAT